MKGKKPQEAIPSRPAIAVFGGPGVGKTWGALEWPNAYMIDVEGGSNLPEYVERMEKSGALYLGPEDGANDFETVNREISWLISKKHDRKTLIIDSFTSLFNNEVFLETERMSAAGEKVAFGNNKKTAVAKSRKMFQRIKQLKMNVLIICQEKALWKNNESIGETFDGWDKIAYDLNLVLHVSLVAGQRMARVTKSRFAKFPINATLPWSYKSLAALFDHQTDEASAPTEMATTEQIETVKTLIDLLKIDPKDIAKVWDSCGASCWEEVTSQRINEAIEKLRNKIDEISQPK